MDHKDSTGLDSVVQLSFRQAAIQPLAAADETKLAGRERQDGIDGRHRTLEPERITHKGCG
jgi:hypothetical protein